jgi:Na+/melibiose symporter-like transporter
MAPGVTLAVIGAILTFAIRSSPTGLVNWHIVGVILMVAGAALIWHAYRGTTRERVITREQSPADGSLPNPIKHKTVVRETIQDRDHE